MAAPAECNVDLRGAGLLRDLPPDYFRIVGEIINHHPEALGVQVSMPRDHGRAHGW